MYELVLFYNNVKKLHIKVCKYFVRIYTNMKKGSKFQVNKYQVSLDNL